MTIAVGDTLPDATFVRMGPDGPEAVQLGDVVRGKKVVLFGLPGAFTPTCDAAHVPSFIRTKPQFDAKGVDAIVCVSVNDAHIMRLWGVNSGATEAGILMLGDADSSFTKAIGMEFSNPKVGFYDRSKRYSMLVEDGVVTILNEEPATGQCEISAGGTLLDQM